MIGREGDRLQRCGCRQRQASEARSYRSKFARNFARNSSVVLFEKKIRLHLSHFGKNPPPDLAVFSTRNFVVEHVLAAELEGEHVVGVRYRL
jgi:hypothetical protein